MCVKSSPVQYVPEQGSKLVLKVFFPSFWKTFLWQAAETGTYLSIKEFIRSFVSAA